MALASQLVAFRTDSMPKKLLPAKVSSKRGNLLSDVRHLILAAREQVAWAVDSGLVTLYWHVGRRIRQDILKKKRAEYGAEIVAALGRQLAWSLLLTAQIPVALADDSAPDATTLRAAVVKSLPLLETAAKGSMEKRKQCFTCHNQALPVLALTTARDRGFKIDTENLQQQVQFTADFLAKNRTNYLAGKGQGGQALTAGYALWALESSGWKPDTTTVAVAEYLLQWQKQLEHWKVQTIRPPTEESLFAVSYVALRGLKTFSTPEQRERVEQRFEQVRNWALKTPAQSTEDHVFRLRLLQVANAGESHIRRATQGLFRLQREDGGWAQLSGMDSDAYATGTALTALHQAGGITTADAAYRRGLQWLLKAQLPDGSWHVQTRSKPIQTYYESGYPHGEDQFISITAASWATIALVDALPKTTHTEAGPPSR